ncbi:cupin domain-containing protein [Helicobacter sp. MIT 14-3879]|uniref:cupin domain-containing protein n=1 Tax=Helicobacter sp. MIT 14-3879 TaxID=2040649 RepID=UPI000E1E93EF|nr:cupin domain-containing protein [Helicobacter sp. MIT 14-3879]RDU65239.1 cupin domain-containing protein [Helicobacter sp. MIT 14-3879]
MASSLLAQEVIKEGSLGEFKGDSKYFSGNVKVKMLFKSDSYRPFSGALVEFSPKARSAWHKHPAGQTLIVTQGVIYTGTENGITQIAKKGDVITCPPEVKHWHGAGVNQSGAHIALTGEKDGQNVTWLEKLSDEEYEDFVKKVKPDM